MLSKKNLAKIDDLLSTKPDYKVKVAEIYGALNINRHVFASLYGCKTYFLRDYTCQKVRAYLYERGINAALFSIIARFLERLHRDKNKFLTAFNSVKTEQRTILSCYLTTELFLFLREYTYRRDGLNYQKIWSMAGAMYFICLGWLIRDCQEPNEVILAMMKLVLAPINGYEIKNN